MNNNEFQIYRDGQKIGNFQSDELSSKFQSGEINANDHYWTIGMADWQPVRKLIESGIIQGPPPPPLKGSSAISTSKFLSAISELLRPGKPAYTDYSQVPYYRKQWFFWSMYFTIIPVALGLLVFGDVYYRKAGVVKTFGVANKIVAGILGVFFMIKIWGGVGEKLEIPLSSSVAEQFCLIPAGSFTMGSPSSEEGRSSDEGQVEVTLSQPFWLAKTEVTQAQWEAVMGNNPSQFKGANLPVENVSWDDAQSFIAKLNDKQILPQGWKCALPTEAQWEYACRAGEAGPYSGGSLDEVGWYGDKSGVKIHEVGQKKPNAWGLHDMHGNVYEWCADWSDDTLKDGTDPLGPSSGDYRVSRGGSWCYFASSCRAASRFRGVPGLRFSDLGFRPALVPSK